jgi:hypothetical protein
MQVWIGIDIGSRGAVVALFEDGTVKTIPLKSAVDITNFLYDIEESHTIFNVALEDVHAIYGSSAKSNFGFGFNTGWIHGIIETFGLKPKMVPPKTWQKYLGFTQKGKLIKQEVADIVLELYPDVKKDLYGSKGALRDGVSDALAIAHYARGNINGN